MAEQPAGDRGPEIGERTKHPFLYVWTLGLVTGGSVGATAHYAAQSDYLSALLTFLAAGGLAIYSGYRSAALQIAAIRKAEGG